MTRTLLDLHPGESARILRVQGDGAFRRRLLDMGVTRTTSILLRRVAPLGDPLEVSVRGYDLTFRKAEAVNIEIESGGDI